MKNITQSSNYFFKTKINFDFYKATQNTFNYKRLILASNKFILDANY